MAFLPQISPLERFALSGRLEVSPSLDRPVVSIHAGVGRPRLPVSPPDASSAPRESREWGYDDVGGMSGDKFFLRNVSQWRGGYFGLME
jgi:hypothetical protein